MSNRRSVRSRWREFRARASILFPGHDRGFFIPYRHRSELTEPSYDLARRALSDGEASYREIIGMADRFADAFARFGGKPPAPRFEQAWFSGLDAAAAYTIVRSVRPKLVVEIGSGHSTRVMLRAIADADLSTRFIAVDPQPRASLQGLAIEWVGKRLEVAWHDLRDHVGELADGDVLFIDSSHILMPGTDLDLLLSEVIPRIRPGVLLHIHDVFLPDPYPRTWQWRGYNEQTAVALLLATRVFEPVFASRFIRTYRNDLFAGHWMAHAPKPDGVFETSVWLRRTAVGPQA